MSNNKPLVSIVMATFNEPVAFLITSISSILEQSYQNIELIIIDDSTLYETRQVIDSFCVDQRVILVRKETRMGFVPALNEGLRIAKGKYIARMDGDDESMKDRIEKQVYFLENNSRCAILGGAMNIMNESQQIISFRSYPSSGIKLLLWTVLRNPLAHPTVMFRRKIVDDGFYYDETFKKSEDIELWLRLRNQGFCIMNLKDVLLNYRVVGDLATKRDKKHFKYNYLARKKNFSLQFFLFDIFSLLIVQLYLYLPAKLRSFTYARENKKCKYL